jgi:hypothetical protein
MAGIFAVTALLWLLLAVCLLVLLVVVFFPGSQLTGAERLIAAFFMLLLATPLAMQLRATHLQIGEMRGNRILFDAGGAEIRLSGWSRERKGLPMVQTRIRWDEISAVTRQRRSFVYPSLIPLAYRLDVFTIRAGGSAISFTVECIPGAKHIAREMAARAGRDLVPL